MDAREEADASKRAFARDAAPTGGGGFGGGGGGAAVREAAAHDLFRRAAGKDPDRAPVYPNSSSGGGGGGGAGGAADTGRMASDVLAILRAYGDFDALGNNDKGCAFARGRLLSIKTLQQMGTLKRQLLEALSAAGLRGQAVPPGLKQSHLEYLGRRSGGGSDGCRLALAQWQEQKLSGGGGGGGGSGRGGDFRRLGDWTCPSCKASVFAFKANCFRCGKPRPESSSSSSSNSAAESSTSSLSTSSPAASAELVAALVGAALFPQVAYLEAPPNKKTGAPCSAEAIRLLVRASPNDEEGGGRETNGDTEASKACVHPSSVAARIGGGGWASPVSCAE